MRGVNNVAFSVKKQVMEEFYFSFVSEKFVQEEDDEPKKPFEFLNELTNEQLIALVASEDSRVIAITLAQLESDKRSAVLARLDEAQKREVLVSIGNLNDIPLQAVVQIANKLNKKSKQLPKTVNFSRGGGKDLAAYPWGSPYIRNSTGCFLGNFKPLRGNYVDDGGLHTIIVAHYWPNDFGLYDMSGNVAEWTNNSFEESAYNFAHDLNMDYSYRADENDPPALKRKVIRGGSWKDLGFYMQTSSRSYEYQDTSKCYIGVRMVQTYLGRSKGDAEADESQVY